MIETTASEAWVKIAASFFGISALECYIVRKLYVLSPAHQSLHVLIPMQLSVRQRGSISSRFANPLQRAETQNTVASRLRSNSSLSAVGDDEHTIEHPVEPRSNTAMLPPVMVIALPVSFREQTILMNNSPR
jgi:hypothetical protein